jgi:electron transfer flavoprotein alpha subunit
VTVFCLVEVEDGVVADVSLRALTLARDLPGALAAVVFDSPSVPVPPHVPPSVLADLAAYGVSDVYAVSGTGGYAPQAWARALGDLAAGAASGAAGAVVVLAAGTDRGNEVLAHAGAITGLPMAANCVAVAAVDAAPGAASAAYEIVRQRWAGLLLEEAVLEAPVALLTVATDAVPALPAEEPGPATVHPVTPSLAAGDLAVRAAETPAGTGGASLASARVVVGGGRGVGSADGFAPLDELASLLGGVVGVSRVVTSEGWRPHTQQVGQTGTKITPDVYLACGISGAIQHIAGCSGAKHIIVINTDPAAPILGRADYAIIGDLHEVIPALVKALRDRS